MRIINNKNQMIDYIKDESQFLGYAQRIVFCHSSEEVKTVLADSYANNTPLTVQGALTGISGGGVPQGGDAVNLSELNRCLGMTFDEDKQCFYIKVEAGMTLEDFNHAIESKHIETEGWAQEDICVYNSFCRAGDMFFPPDPTETEASIGGMVACDASGACSFLYGSTRNYVESIRIITPHKDLYIKRGMYRYGDLPKLIGTEDAELPKLQPTLDDIKNVAGLYYKDDMDLIDLFIGSEGILGIITEIELKILAAPKTKIGMMFFFNSADTLVGTVNYLRGSEMLCRPCAIEYFDEKTFGMLNEFRSMKPAISALPSAPTDNRGGLYIEFHIDDDSKFDKTMEQIFGKFDEFGLNKQEQWVAFEASDYEKLKDIRHAVPECINMLVAQEKTKDDRIRKVGTDMAVADKYLENILSMYKKGIQAGEYNAIIFGHIGSNHLHVNFIPSSYRVYNDAMKLTLQWAETITSFNGTVTAEHGIGKLKKVILEKMIGKEKIESMKCLKMLLDPRDILNKETLL